MGYVEELSNLEMRNLILEVLAYEGKDIDAEGKTFKDYGYQGTQSDLYRLLDGLLIVKKIKPENEKIKIHAAAWGGSGFTLFEGSTTNLKRSEILKLYQEFHNLILQGVIAPGAYGNYGDDLPYFHVTEYGKECIKQIDVLPYDEGGYLTKLKTIQGMDDWITFYVTEALKCFNANCVNSSMINIGLAGEVIIEHLVDNYGSFLNKKIPLLQTKYLRELSSNWGISAKYDTYLSYRKKYIDATGDPEVKKLAASLDKSSSTIYATYTRLTRNSVTHPNEIIMDRMKVLMFFITFVDYCEMQYKFINHYKNNS